jgi:beta-galactosidase
MHAGLLRPDDQPAPAYAEARQVAQEIAATGIAGEARKARVAIVYDYESEWAWAIQPQAKGFSHHAQVRAAYVPLRKRGVDVDILPPTAESFAGYDLVIIPAVFTWSDALRKAMEQFDGHLLIGPRTGSKTENFSIPARLPPNLPQNLLDVKVVRVDSTDPVRNVSAKGGGAVRLWRERLETGANIEIEDEEGFPVLVSQGRLFYLGAAGDRALMQRVIDQMLDEADIPTIALPAGVRCRVRDGLRIYFNYADSAATLTLAADETGYVLGGADLPPGGVSVAKCATADADR